MGVPVIGTLIRAFGKLTRGQKILAIVAVIIIAMFTTTTATSGRHGDTEGDPQDNSLVQSLGDLFGGTPEADPAELTTTCPDAAGGPEASPTPAASPAAGGHRRLAVDGSCVITAARSDEDLRTVTLAAQDAPLRLTARAPHDDAIVDADVAAGETIEVSVDGDGAAITVSCDGVPSCVVALGKAA